MLDVACNLSSTVSPGAIVVALILVASSTLIVVLFNEAVSRVSTAATENPTIVISSPPSFSGFVILITISSVEVFEDFNDNLGNALTNFFATFNVFALVLSLPKYTLSTLSSIFDVMLVFKTKLCLPTGSVSFTAVKSIFFQSASNFQETLFPSNSA